MAKNPGDLVTMIEYRDWLAAMALPGCVAVCPSLNNGKIKVTVGNIAAQLAYEIADAMLAERSK